MSTKIIGALLVIVLLGGGGFFLLSKKSTQAAPALSDTSTQTQTTPSAAESAGTAQTQQSGSVEDFSAQIDSEISATNAAIGSFDADTDTSVNSVKNTGDTSKLYDPNNL